MKCPICGARIFPGSDRCSDCGCHVRSHTEPFAETRPHRSTAPWGRLLLLLLVIIPVLLIITFSSLIIFSEQVHQEPVIPEPNHSVSIPPDRVPGSLPDADEGCFSISDGEVTFLPWCWDGSPIVRVPETVDGQTVTALAPGCFSGCAELTTILLPETIVSIGPEAFSGCTGLRGLYLPDGTETVERDAFAGCLSLDAVYVPASMISIEEGCFADCAGLLYIFYDGTYEEWIGLYDGYITPFTAAICLDGSYYHGVGG